MNHGPTKVACTFEHTIACTNACTVAYAVACTIARTLACTSACTVTRAIACTVACTSRVLRYILHVHNYPPHLGTATAVH